MVERRVGGKRGGAEPGGASPGGAARAGVGRVVIVTSAAKAEDPTYIRELAGRDGGGRPATIICADGGLEVALGLDLEPDLLVGDFDSVNPAVLDDFRRGHPDCPVRTFPSRKDKTDTHLALEAALEMGPREIVVAGAFGDRFDHTLGLVLLLAGLGGGEAEGGGGIGAVGAAGGGAAGAAGGGTDGAAGGETAGGPNLPPVIWLAGARGEAHLLRAPGGLELSGEPGDTVSLLPLTPQVTGVGTRGLSYPLTGATLRWGETLGVSNEMTGLRAEVVAVGGTLLVVHLRGGW